MVMIIMMITVCCNSYVHRLHLSNLMMMTTKKKMMMVMMMLRAVSGSIPTARGTGGWCGPVLAHMGNPKENPTMIEILDYRTYAQHSAGHQEHELSILELPDYLFRYYILLLVAVTVFNIWLQWETFTYKNSSTSTWRRPKSPSSVAPAGTSHSAHRGPKSPNRVGLGLPVHCAAGLLMAYFVNNQRILNPLDPPWWPEGSGPATRFGGAISTQALHAPLRRSQVA